jgi:hypothetical protein
MAFGELSFIWRNILTNTHFRVLWQVLREAVVDLVVEEEDAGVAEATVEVGAARGVDVRDCCFKPVFHSY